jgi:hypothetical protein
MVPAPIDRTGIDPAINLDREALRVTRGMSKGIAEVHELPGCMANGATC